VLIDIRRLLPDFSTENNHESPAGFFLCATPWVAPLAYLHIVFRPITDTLLKSWTAQLGLPLPLNLFFRQQNGAILFSGALTFYGLHAPAQLLSREDPFAQLPFDIQNEGQNWPPVDTKQFLVIGGYGFNGSTVCIDKSNLRVVMFKRESTSLEKKPSYGWETLEECVVSEISRLSTMFDKSGKRLVDERLTVPDSSSSS
jgi:hypothetical protein